jgi:HSP20 family protein
MENKKRSFWDKLTGGVEIEEDVEETRTIKNLGKGDKKGKNNANANNWMEEENEEAELALDLYQTPTHIIIETMVAGVKPDDLDLTIGRDIITIRGKREESKTIDEDNYFCKELYWGKFSRTISLPSEVEPEEVDATERHGLLTIKLQKVDKNKTNNVKIKSL